GVASVRRVIEVRDAARGSADWGSAGASGASADWGSAGAISGPPQMKTSASDKPPNQPAQADQPAEANAPAQLETGAIEFRNLTFAYDERGPALRDISFTVPAGSVVAVVGPTGSGKSTLGTLLCRLYEPPRGTVWLGGRDVRELRPGLLRRSVGYVPQESFLFSRPLRDNVR